MMVEPVLVGPCPRRARRERDAGIVHQDVDAPPRGSSSPASASTAAESVTSSRAARVDAERLQLRHRGLDALRRHPASTTVAPASASACAQARPMPCPPPVTTALRPLRLYFSRYIAGLLRYFTAPKVRPRTSWRWLIQPKMRIGAIASTEAAESFAQNRPCGAEKLAMKAVSGAALCAVRLRLQNASFQHRMMPSSAGRGDAGQHQRQQHVNQHLAQVGAVDAARLDDVLRQVAEEGVQHPDRDRQVASACMMMISAVRVSSSPVSRTAGRSAPARRPRGSILVDSIQSSSAARAVRRIERHREGRRHGDDQRRAQSRRPRSRRCCSANRR